jgi:hypothetical protein
VLQKEKFKTYGIDSSCERQNLTVQRWSKVRTEQGWLPYKQLQTTKNERQRHHADSAR